MLFARLFYDAAMDPAEDAGCHCRVPNCREPYVQQWTLQRVQSASAECCRAECHACSGKSPLLHLQTVDLEPQGFALFASHMRRSCKPFMAPLRVIKFCNSRKHHPNSYSVLKEFQKEQMDSETSVMELDLEKSVKSSLKKMNCISR